MKCISDVSIFTTHISPLEAVHDPDQLAGLREQRAERAPRRHGTEDGTVQEDRPHRLAHERLSGRRVLSPHLTKAGSLEHADCRKLKKQFDQHQNGPTRRGAALIALAAPIPSRGKVNQIHWHAVKCPLFRLSVQSGVAFQETER